MTKKICATPEASWLTTSSATIAVRRQQSGCTVVAALEDYEKVAAAAHGQGVATVRSRRPSGVK